MSKLAVNNEVVAMRNAVRQAKVHIVHKLVREIKKLKSKTYSKLVAKFTRKAEKLGEEVLIIKKLKEDDVSKYALTTSDIPSKVLTNPSADAQFRALARLSCHKSIANRVMAFKEKYKDLEPSIEDMLLTGKKKQRKLKHIEGKEKIKQAKMKEKKRSDVEISRKEWLEDNTDFKIVESDQMNEFPKEKIADVPQCHKNIDKHVKKSEPQILAIPKQDRLKTLNIQQKEFGSPQLGDDQNNSENSPTGDGQDESGNETDQLSNEDDECKNKSDYSGDGQNESGNETDQSDDEQECKRIDEEPGFAILNRLEKVKSKQRMFEPVKLDKNPVAIKTVDSFFLTDSGENYMSSYVPKPTEEEDSKQIISGGQNRQQRRANIFGNVVRPKKRAMKEYSNSVIENIKEKKTISEDSTPMNTDLFNRTTNKRLKITDNISKSDKKPASSEKMHPSWEAKKMQKSQIAEFKGTKITFDD